MASDTRQYSKPTRRPPSVGSRRRDRPLDRLGDRKPLAGTFLTAAVTAALIARKFAAFADALIFHSFSLPSRHSFQAPTEAHVLTVAISRQYATRQRGGPLPVVEEVLAEGREFGQLTLCVLQLGLQHLFLARVELAFVAAGRQLDELPDLLQRFGE